MKAFESFHCASCRRLMQWWEGMIAHMYPPRVCWTCRTESSKRIFLGIIAFIVAFGAFYFPGVLGLVVLLFAVLWATNRIWWPRR